MPKDNYIVAAIYFHIPIEYKERFEACVRDAFDFEAKNLGDYGETSAGVLELEIPEAGPEFLMLRMKLEQAKIPHHGYYSPSSAPINGVIHFEHYPLGSDEGANHLRAWRWRVGDEYLTKKREGNNA